MKINPHASAVPHAEIHEDRGNAVRVHLPSMGIPIRLELASRAMSSILTNPVVNPLEIGDKHITELSFFFADALIATYNDSES